MSIYDQTFPRFNLTDYFKEVFGSPASEQILYHYTSMDSFYHIAKNQSIWMTEVSYLNDVKEHTYGVGIAIEAAEEYIQNREYKSLNSSYSEEYYKMVVKCLEDNVISLLRRYNRDETYLDFSYYSQLPKVRQSNLFIFSLSAERNSLSQWIAYSGEGGVSIGFDHSQVLSSLEKGTAFRISRCEYDPAKQKEIIKGILNLQVNQINCEAKGSTKPGCDGYVEGYAEHEGYCVDYIMQLASMFKNKAFKHENECRIVAFINKDSFESHPEQYPVDFRVKGGLMIPYLNLQFGESQDNSAIIDSYKVSTSLKSIVTHLMLGPSKEPRLALKSIEAFSRKYLDDFVIIEYTDIPFIYR